MKLSRILLMSEDDDRLPDVHIKRISPDTTVIEFGAPVETGDSFSCRGGCGRMITRNTMGPGGLCRECTIESNPHTSLGDHTGESYHEDDEDDGW
jgi:hypothetical protein